MMRQRTTLLTTMTCLVFGVGLQGCNFFGLSPSMPDLSGTYIAHNADLQADKKTVDEILMSFKQTEAAVSRGDVEGVMQFYAKGYKHQGFTAVTLQSVWKNLFQEYHDLSITHVLSRVKVEADATPPTARITCTGSLWGVSNQTGQRVNIDSWFEEVYYLVYENGAWRTQGHAWEALMDKDTRAARQPHPFF